MMERMLEKIAAVWFIISGLVALTWTSPSEYLDYKRSIKPRLEEELRRERKQLDKETGLFREQVGARSPSEWTLGEGAWYESIRRREATI